MKLLLVEDDLEYASLVIRWLQGSHDTHHRASIAEASKAIRQQNYDLILLDLTLPDSSGIATFVQITEHADETPVVVLSGNNNEEIWLEAMQAGAQDYLDKFQVDGPYVLEKTIHNSIIRKGLEVQLFRDRTRQKEVIQRVWHHSATIGILMRDALTNAGSYEHLMNVLDAAEGVQRTFDPLNQSKGE